MRSMHENWQTVASGFPLHDSEAHLLACVESIVTTMMSFSDNCALIGEPGSRLTLFGWADG